MNVNVNTGRKHAQEQEYWDDASMTWNQGNGMDGHNTVDTKMRRVHIMSKVAF